MKRVLSIILVLSLLLISLAFISSCSKKDDTNKDSENNPQTQDPSGDTPGGNDPQPKEPVLLKWEVYYALTPEEKDEYIDSFETLNDFVDWMIDAQAQFVIDYPEVEMGADGTIDLSKIP